MIEPEALKPGDYVIAEFGIMSPSNQKLVVKGFVESPLNADRILKFRDGTSVSLGTSIPVTLTIVDNMVDFDFYGRSRSRRNHPSSFKR